MTGHDALPLCEFCGENRVQEVQTDGIWAGCAYCDACLARPNWLPQPAYLVAQYTPEGPVLYGPEGVLTREAFAEFWASRRP